MDLLNLPDIIICKNLEKIHQIQILTFTKQNVLDKLRAKYYYIKRW